MVLRGPALCNSMSFSHRRNSEIWSVVGGTWAFRLIASKLTPLLSRYRHTRHDFEPLPSMAYPIVQGSSSPTRSSYVISIGLMELPFAKIERWRRSWLSVGSSTAWVRVKSWPTRVFHSFCHVTWNWQSFNKEQHTLTDSRVTILARSIPLSTKLKLNSRTAETQAAASASVALWTGTVTSSATLAPISSPVNDHCRTIDCDQASSSVDTRSGYLHVK